jgi:hypothetical protein
MIMLLIFWVCASTVVCLAFLSAAARAVPPMEEEMAAEGEPAVRQETVVALGMPKIADPAPRSRHPSPPLNAKKGKLTQAQTDDLPSSFPSIPALHPGRAQNCLSPK